MSIKCKSKQPIALQYLDADVLDLIGEFCGPYLLCLRLTSRGLNDGTFTAFCRCFIRTQTVFVNLLPSLEQFVELSRYRPLRHHVRTILLSDVSVEELWLRTNENSRYPSGRSARVKEYLQTERYLSHGYAVQMLSNAFRRFANCTTLGLASLERCVKHNQIIALAGDIFGHTNVRRNELCLEKDSNPKGISDLLLAALLHSNIQVETFTSHCEVPGNTESRPSFNMAGRSLQPFPEILGAIERDWLPIPKALEPVLAARLQSLRCLSLGIPMSSKGVHKRLNSNTSASTISAMGQMLSVSTNLKKLELYTSLPSCSCRPPHGASDGGNALSRHAQQEVVDMLRSTKLEKLDHLTITDCCEGPAWFRRSTITAILCHFSNSLRSVALSRLCFPDSVVPILVCLRDELTLTSLRLAQIDEHSYVVNGEAQRRRCCTPLEKVDARDNVQEVLETIISELSVNHPSYDLPYAECIYCNGRLVTLPPLEPTLRVTRRGPGSHNISIPPPPGMTPMRWRRMKGRTRCVQTLPERGQPHIIPPPPLGGMPLPPHGMMPQPPPPPPLDNDASLSQSDNETGSDSEVDVRASPSPPGSPNSVGPGRSPSPVHPQDLDVILRNIRMQGPQPRSRPANQSSTNSHALVPTSPVYSGSDTDSTNSTLP